MWASHLLKKVTCTLKTLTRQPPEEILTDLTSGQFLKSMNLEWMWSQIRNPLPFLKIKQNIKSLTFTSWRSVWIYPRTGSHLKHNISFFCVWRKRKETIGNYIQSQRGLFIVKDITVVNINFVPAISLHEASFIMIKLDRFSFQLSNSHHERLITSLKRKKS